MWENFDMAALELIDVYKSFGAAQAVRGVSFSIDPGEIIALLGPSGCGKSTILGLIAGLDTPDSGQFLWNGTSLEGVPIHQRGFGLMFQDYALFPHMSVYNNVAFGLRMTGTSPDYIRSRVKEVLELVGLPDFDRRDVHTLSGGEQQRVALARSLAPQPHLLMLDEPLGSLDRNLRERLIDELGQILRSTRQTAIYVTHDQDEAFALADRVVVMNAGAVEQVDTPQAIYQKPATPFVARFLGMRNILPGEIIHIDGKAMISAQIGMLQTDHHPLGKVTFLLHPDAIRLGADGPVILEGRLEGCTYHGSTFHAVISVRDVPLEFDFLSTTNMANLGGRVELSFDPAQAVQIWVIEAVAEVKRPKWSKMGVDPGDHDMEWG
jgi:ABC-type Fe3+/spermidine/putrescine transport system ATPase subunit